MKAIIFLNGEYGYNKNFFDKIMDKNDIIFCADGGANYTYKYKIIPHYIIGDLDSIEKEILNYYINKKVNIEKYNPEKDFTDFELILLKIKEYEKNNNIKFEKKCVMGGLGNRIDMTLNNMSMLEKYSKLIFFTPEEEIFYTEKNINLTGKKGKGLSIISLDEKIEKLTLEGFKYEIKNLDIERKSSRLVSNVIINDNAKIKFVRGKILIILNENLK